MFKKISNFIHILFFPITQFYKFYYEVKEENQQNLEEKIINSYFIEKIVYEHKYPENRVYEDYETDFMDLDNGRIVSPQRRYSLVNMISFFFM